MCYCAKEGRKLKKVMFYTYKDGSLGKMCKKCMTMHIDNYDPDSFKWLLQDFDVPWVPIQWNNLLNRAYAKDPDTAANSSAVFGKYLAVMKLKEWSKYSWADTERLAQEQAQREGISSEEKQKADQELTRELQQKFSRGQITQAQYKTLLPIQGQAAPGPTVSSKPAKSANRAAAAVISEEFNEDDYLNEKDLPDPAANLTEQDKIKLAIKWGRLYKPNQWIQLEQDYRKMIKSFAINDADTENSLMLICKLNLKANQCLDRGDFDGFAKLSKELSSQRKLANFAAIGRKKESQEDFLTSVGQLVAYCQKNGGQIPKHEIVAPKDIVDEQMMDNKNYLKTLIYSDPALSREIQDFMKKKQIQEEQKKDRAQAKAKGLPERQLTDKDFADYSDFINQQKQHDEAQEAEN